MVYIIFHILKKQSRNSSDGEVRKHYLKKAFSNQKFGKQLIKLCFTLSQALEQILHIPQKSQLYKLNLSVQFSSVAQLCPTPSDSMNCSMPGLPVHHQLPEFTQTHVHWVGDAIQPSHPLLSPSPPAPNPSQHQGLF